MASSTNRNRTDITFKIPANLKPGDEFTLLGMRAVISEEVEVGTFEVHLGSEKVVYRFRQEEA